MLELNLKNNAASQTTLPFNSMCKFGNHYLGAANDGLFKIEGYNDNGAQIPVLIRSGTTDFNTTRYKRVRFFYFGLQSDGDLKLTIFCNGVEVSNYIVTSTDGVSKEIRVPINRSNIGQYWHWQIENINGSFFVLYSVSALVIVLSR